MKLPNLMSDEDIKKARIKIEMQAVVMILILLGLFIMVCIQGGGFDGESKPNDSRDARIGERSH